LANIKNESHLEENSGWGSFLYKKSPEPPNFQKGIYCQALKNSQKHRPTDQPTNQQ